MKWIKKIQFAHIDFFYGRGYLTGSRSNSMVDLYDRQRSNIRSFLGRIFGRQPPWTVLAGMYEHVQYSAHRLCSCPIKTARVMITKYSLWSATKTLVFRGKLSSFWVKGFTFLTFNVHFSSANPNSLGSKRLAPTLIAKVAGPLLSRVTWALLKLLVCTTEVTGVGLFD